MIERNDNFNLSNSFHLFVHLGIFCMLSPVSTVGCTLVSSAMVTDNAKY